MLSFKALLIFCLHDLPLDDSGMLKLLSTAVLLSSSPFMAVLVFAIYIEVLLCWVHIYINNCYMFYLDRVLHHSVVSALSLVTVFILMSILSEYCYPSFLLISICIESIFQSPHFQSVFVPRFEVSHL